MFAKYMQAMGRLRFNSQLLKLKDEVFHLIGRKRLVKEFDLKTVLEEKKFTVDVEAGEIFRREYDKYGMLDWDVTFEVNAGVLGIR